MLKWNPSLAVGHAEIDAQHAELFDRLGCLLQAMACGDRSEVGKLFDFLCDYVLEHFAAEEQLMREVDFPGYGVHKAAHDRFVRDYAELRRLFEASGASAAVAIKAKTWLVDWLRAHIAGTDQLLANHLLRRAG